MSLDFFFQIAHITDVASLELLRAELVNQAADAGLTWEARMAIYKKVQAIIERLMQLEAG